MALPGVRAETGVVGGSRLLDRLGPMEAGVAHPAAPPRFASPPGSATVTRFGAPGLPPDLAVPSAIDAAAPGVGGTPNRGPATEAPWASAPHRSPARAPAVPGSALAPSALACPESPASL